MFPEGLTLLLDGRELRIVDAQETTHVTFSVGIGDPTTWSESVVRATCDALGVEDAFDFNRDLETTVSGVIDEWHERLDASDTGFIPHDEPNMDTEIGYKE